MREISIVTKLEKKEVKDEELAEDAAKNQESLRALLDSISSSNPKVKFRSAKILRLLSERESRILYPSWNFFVKLLDSKNNIIKWNAIDIIANLTKVDSERKLDRVFKKFYSDLLCEGSLITAGHIVNGLAVIVRARPEFEHVITQELLKVENVPLPTEECRNILIGHAIKAFDAYLDRTVDKGEIKSFVKRQLSNSRRATKNKAEKLLRKLENNNLD